MMPEQIIGFLETIKIDSECRVGDRRAVVDQLLDEFRHETAVRQPRQRIVLGKPPCIVLGVSAKPDFRPQVNQATHRIGKATKANANDAYDKLIKLPSLMLGQELIQSIPRVKLQCNNRYNRTAFARFHPERIRLGRRHARASISCR